MGRNPVAVTGYEGREALEAALRVVDAIAHAHSRLGANAGALTPPPTGPGLRA
jgi:hypothetical protein